MVMDDYALVGIDYQFWTQIILTLKPKFMLSCHGEAPLGTRSSGKRQRWWKVAEMDPRMSELICAAFMWLKHQVRLQALQKAPWMFSDKAIKKTDTFFFLFIYFLFQRDFFLFHCKLSQHCDFMVMFLDLRKWILTAGINILCIWLLHLSLSQNQS